MTVAPCICAVWERNAVGSCDIVITERSMPGVQTALHGLVAWSTVVMLVRGPIPDGWARLGASADVVALEKCNVNHHWCYPDTQTGNATCNVGKCFRETNPNPNSRPLDFLTVVYRVCSLYVETSIPEPMGSEPAWLLINNDRTGAPFASFEDVAADHRHPRHCLLVHAGPLDGECCPPSNDGTTPRLINGQSKTSQWDTQGDSGIGSAPCTPSQLLSIVSVTSRRMPNIARRMGFLKKNKVCSQRSGTALGTRHPAAPTGPGVKLAVA